MNLASRRFQLYPSTQTDTSRINDRWWERRKRCVRETRETRFSCSSPHFYWLLLVILKSIVLQQNMSSDRFGSKSDWLGPVRSGPDWSGPVRSGSDCFGSNRPEPVRFGPVRFGPVRFGPVLTMYHIS